MIDAVCRRDEYRLLGPSNQTLSVTREVGQLAVGFAQPYRLNRACQRRSPLSIAIFALASIVVLGVLVLPQLTAGLLAGIR